MNNLHLFSKLYIMLFAIFAVACNSQAQFQQLAPQEFLEQFSQDKNAILLDVRTPEEIAEGHLKGAEYINFNAADFDQKIAALDKNKTIYVYCASGGRSGKTCTKLNDLKIKSVNLSGGIQAWRKEGLEVVKP